MWLAKQRMGEIRQEALSEEGNVTASSMPTSVYLEGERRNVPVFSPGGYCWRPENGQAVLVLKAGGEGEQPCVVGCRTEDRGLQPGEVSIYAGQSEMRLKKTGEVALTGEITVNGVRLEELVRQIVMTMLG